MIYCWVNRALLLLSGLLFIVSCSDGIDGTGGKPDTSTVLKGTAATGSPAGQTEIIIKGSNGARASGTTDQNGKFSIDVKGLEAPYLLRVEIDNTRLYSLAPALGVNNITPLSDLVARNWFRSRSRSIDDEFDDGNAINSPPSLKEIADLIAAVRNLLSAVFNEFSLDNNFSFQHSDFDANSTGFDFLLDNIQIVINQNLITNKLPRRKRTGY